ncbi:methylated-DNA--[protein]-cysteine S-methyltransferase [Porphyromonadaceae bacterium OttesenSCG-928-L07]|nr:methylated-DNA--[protein]-cysteine S-methyltransferase [Porphyromonadaceae bacterium OttesenSCG-928-L07]
MYYFSYTPSICPLWILANETGIVKISFSKLIGKAIEKETSLIKQAMTQIEEYLEGRRKVFDFPMDPQGTTFQKNVWSILQQIPYGETWSYKQVAIAVGNPNASRAVGMANNKNPLPIVVPCHRVIGANGKLTGYAGGLDVKERLLDLEQKHV